MRKRRGFMEGVGRNQREKLRQSAINLRGQLQNINGNKACRTKQADINQFEYGIAGLDPRVERSSILCGSSSPSFSLSESIWLFTEHNLISWNVFSSTFSLLLSRMIRKAEHCSAMLNCERSFRFTNQHQSITASVYYCEQHFYCDQSFILQSSCC